MLPAIVVQFMGYFFSMSKSNAESWLNWSELALFIFGVILVFGLIGEHMGIRWPTWKAREHVFSILVLVGVAGELLADGGIFGFGRQLQAIVDQEVSQANKRAGEAEKAAAESNERAAKANENAEALRKQTVELSKGLEEVVIDTYPRTFIGRKAASERLNKYAGTNVVVISSLDEESKAVAIQIRKTLHDAGWNLLTITNFSVDPRSSGVVITFLNLQRVRKLAQDSMPEQVAATVLVDELIRSKIMAQHINLWMPFDRDPTKCFMLVSVGPRPTPMESLIMQASRYNMSPSERSNAWNLIREKSE